MMRLLFLSLLLLQAVLFANDTACKKCHPTIYAEFYDSMHRKSSPTLDKVHNAVWNLHPLKAKNDYSCAKCHTPDPQNTGNTHDAVSCTTCHTIISIKEHPTANENVYSHKPKTFFSSAKGETKGKVKFHQSSGWFGLNTTTSGSPYHTIDYTNTDFTTGKVCMGCHSHKQNSHGYELCRTPEKGAADTAQNCITCHMPQVKGSATSITQTQTHAFHGFAGVYTDPQLLEKYVELSFKRTDKGFALVITNHAPHDLMLHPLRVAELQTALIREDQTITLPPRRFVKLIGKEGKPTMPWQATEVVKDTMLKAGQTQTFGFDTPLQEDDRIEATLGFYPVNPDATTALKLEDSPRLTGFKRFKKVHFTVKKGGN